MRTTWKCREVYDIAEQREPPRRAVQFAPYNTIINHLPTMILFAASGPGVTYRDAPRTLGDDTSPRYVILLSAPQRKRTEESCPGSDVQPSTDRPIALSGVNRSSRARHFQTVKTLLPRCANKKLWTVKEDWFLARIVLPWFMHFLSAPCVAAYVFTVDVRFLTEPGRNHDVDKSWQFF